MFVCIVDSLDLEGSTRLVGSSKLGGSALLSLQNDEAS